MEAGRHNGMKSPFRWLLTAARYVAASVMTVLILIVMVKAIKVLLQPEFLSLSVVRGCMFVGRIGEHPPRLGFQFTVRVLIPRSGARMHFRNISAYIFGKDTPPSSPHPSDDCLIFFKLADITPPPRQQLYVDDTKTANVSRDPEVVVVPFFDMLYNRSHNDIISDVTMRLDGIVSQVTSTSSYNRNTTYYCWPLVVGLDPKAVWINYIQRDYWSLVAEDVFCREEQGKHLI